MSDQEIPVPEYYETPRQETGDFYTPDPIAREFVEKFLNLQCVASYECTSSAKWDPDIGIIHRFEVEIGPDVSHSMRVRLEKRVIEFMKNEIKTILYGY